MTLTSLIIVICWVIFLLFWGFSAIGVKKDIGNKSFLRQNSWLIRIGALGIVILYILQRIFFERSEFTHRPFLDNFLPYAWSLSPNSTTGIIGATLCIFGIGLAIWARTHLGREWSSHPTIKEGHKLITSGPYSYIRHPIYSGILLATLGSAIASGAIWLIYFFLILIIFVRRVQIEEQLMTKLFPDQYPEYKKRTKALIPFVW